MNHVFNRLAATVAIAAAAFWGAIAIAPAHAQLPGISGQPDKQRLVNELWEAVKAVEAERRCALRLQPLGDVPITTYTKLHDQCIDLLTGPPPFDAAPPPPAPQVKP